jgi:hypothetical protein
MTSTYDYPDWQSAQNARATYIAGGTTTITSTSPIVIEGWVTNFDSILLYVAMTAGIGVTVGVNFYENNVGGPVSGTLEYVLNLATKLQVQIPILGSYMIMTIGTAQTGNQSFQYSVQACRADTLLGRFPVSGNFIANSAFTVPADTVESFYLPYVVEGPGYASLSFFNSYPDLFCQLWYLNEAQASQGLIWSINSPTPGSSDNILFRGINYPLQLQLQNTGATSVEVDYFVKVDSQ